MSQDTTHLAVGVPGDRDELFTTPSTDPAPDRHPSVLRPGGHASPLKYPAALRPGAGRRSRTPSPGATSTASSAAAAPVAYRAYSPPRAQSPSDELSAEIEEYFTALEVPPLNINKPPSPGGEEGSPQERCASPPVPPKERISREEERHVASPLSELDASAGREGHDDRVVSPVLPDSEGLHHEDQPAAEPAEPPPAYEESQHVPPPPEKAATPQPPAAADDQLLASTSAASAAHVGSAVIGISTDEAVQNSSDALAAATTDTAAEATAEGEHEGEAAGQQGAGDAVPPPLPPRPSPSPAGKGKEPAMHVPGAFPPPPSRPVPSSYKAGGAAATSAATVGGAVAGVGQSSGLQQARKALEKGLGHLIDKAKEHHQAKEQHGHDKQASKRRKSPDGARKKANAAAPAHAAQVHKPSTQATKTAKDGANSGRPIEMYYK